MPATLTLVLVAFMVAVALAGLVIALVAYRRASGPRVVTCPATHQPVEVHLDTGRAWWGFLRGRRQLELASCTRFEGRPTCAQKCLSEIEAAPDGCLVRTTIAGWYEGKECALCSRVISHISQGDHRPGLLTPAGASLDWSEVDYRTVGEVMQTHRPVCWDCHVVQTLYRKHPELVVERDPKWSGPLAAADPAAVGDLVH